MGGSVCCIPICLSLWSPDHTRCSRHMHLWPVRCNFSRSPPPQHPLWNSLLTHMSSLGCIVEGTLAHLRPSTVAFPIQRRPFQYVPEAHLALLSAHTAHDAPPRPDYEDPDAARAPNGAQPQPLFSVPAFNPFSGLSTPARPGSQQSQQGLAPPFLDPFAAYLGSAPRSQGAWSDYSLASQPSVAGRRESKNYQR